MKKYKNNIGKILVMSGGFIGTTCVLYKAFNSSLILGIIVLSIMMVFFGLLLCMNEK